VGALPGKVPNYLVPATAHYSWPKAGSLLGLGEDQMLRVAVDKFGRLDLDKLEASLRKMAEDKVGLPSPPLNLKKIALFKKISVLNLVLILLISFHLGSCDACGCHHGFYR
jgi:hypothetical protein